MVGTSIGVTSVPLLISKGTRQASWVAVSGDALRWLARYLAHERPTLEPRGPLWLTLRHPLRPLGYQALRAVLLRIDEQLGAHWTLHDFRHTCGIRLAAALRFPSSTFRRISSIGTFRRPRPTLLLGLKT